MVKVDVKKDNQTDKHLKNIQNAGQSIRVLGWATLAIAPVLFSINGSVTDYIAVVLYLVIAVPVSLFLLLAGKYVQNGGTKNTQFFLVFSMLIAIACMGGIIPIFVAFASIVALSSYSKLSKQNQLSKIKKSKTSLSAIEVIFFIAIVILCSTLVWYTAHEYYSDGSGSTNSSIQESKNLGSNPNTPTELASYSATEAKKSTTLPYEVDEVTTLTDITSEGNEIKYIYTIHDADTSNLSDSVLEATVKPNFCADTDVKNLLNQGILMSYLYTVKETGAQYSFKISKASC